MLVCDLPLYLTGLAKAMRRDCRAEGIVAKGKRSRQRIICPPPVRRRFVRTRVSQHRSAARQMKAPYLGRDNDIVHANSTLDSLAVLTHTISSLNFSGGTFYSLSLWEGNEMLGESTGSQPEGLPESSRGSKRSADPRKRSINDSQPEGGQPNSVTRAGSKYNCLLTRGYRCAQPPATISQPYGLLRSYLRRHTPKQ